MARVALFYTFAFIRWCMCVCVCVMVRIEMGHAEQKRVEKYGRCKEKERQLLNWPNNSIN